MSTTAKQIMDKVAITLSDIDNLRWTRAELLGWVNEAQATAVLIQPQSTSVVATVTTVAGTRQTLPTGGWMLLDVYRNMGADSNTPGRAVRGVSRQLLDAFNPNWHSAAKSATAKNFLTDQQDKSHFWVYPPSNGSMTLQISYAAAPTPLAAETDTLAINDIYAVALGDYVLYKAHSKPVDGANAQLAGSYLANFTGLLGGKEASEQANNPAGAIGTRGGDAPGANS